MRGTKIWLSQELRDDLERFARSRTLAARLVQRAQIVLMAAAHKSDQEIAQAVGVVRQTVGLWRDRFVEQGISGIEKDAPRSGRPRTITPARIDEIVRLTTQSTPVAATHWSNRTLAPLTEVSPSTIGRIWRAHGLKPHLVKSFKLSNDPRFAENMRRYHEECRVRDWCLTHTLVDPQVDRSRGPAEQSDPYLVLRVVRETRLDRKPEPISSYRRWVCRYK